MKFGLLDVHKNLVLKGDLDRSANQAQDQKPDIIKMGSKYYLWAYDHNARNRTSWYRETDCVEIPEQPTASPEEINRHRLGSNYNWRRRGKELPDG